MKVTTKTKVDNGSQEPSKEGKMKKENGCGNGELFEECECKPNWTRRRKSDVEEARKRNKGENREKKKIKIIKGVNVSAKRTDKEDLQKRKF